MMETALPTDLTLVINDMDSKDRHAVERLLPVVYADLRRLADSFFRRERADHTLQPTALVHEAYLQLMKSANGTYESREHFFRTAAVVMRHLLLKHARGRGADKRGGGMQKQALSDSLLVVEDDHVDLFALDEALKKLTRLDARQAEIVELRFFAGLSVAEAAEVLGVSKRTVEEDWTLARAWLWRELRR